MTTNVGSRYLAANLYYLLGFREYAYRRRAIEARRRSPAILSPVMR